MASAESRIHDSGYHVLLCLSTTNKVFILSKLPRRSNGRVRERKQRGRTHWWRRKCWTAEGGGEREMIFKRRRGRHAGRGGSPRVVRALIPTQLRDARLAWGVRGADQSSR